VQPRRNLLRYNQTSAEKIKYFLKTNGLSRKIFKRKFYYQEDFEYYPVIPAEKKVLFLTRLWNPAEGKTPQSVELRKKINETRLECIKRCKKEYGTAFTGGLFNEAYASQHYPELVAPGTFTNKKSYLDNVKNHAICIATTGLHHSIGWKFGEYVAASRAIVSEPLAFSLPGDFQRDKNYREFRTPDELVNHINVLRDNNEVMLNMMKHNFYYYNNFVKPENMVLNTIITVVNN
jgi:hypothetical protein